MDTLLPISQSIVLGRDLIIAQYISIYTEVCYFRFHENRLFSLFFLSYYIY